MRQLSVLESGSRAAAQPVASCSYSTLPNWTSRRIQQRQHACGPTADQSAGRRRLAAPAPLLAPHRPTDNSRPIIVCAAGEDVISGYTPANYISFSEHPADVAGHGFSVVVDAPASVCFGIWNDWNRLVEFLDLVAQIGLDPKNPDMALFQTFYRHGLLPVMEIVFVLQKTQVVENERIEFESVWGMPMSGSVSFRPLDGADGSRTEVTLEFAQALPTLLVDLKVGVFGVQSSLRPILSDNLVAFKELAEELAAAAGSQKGKAGRPRPEAGERQYLLFDERADVQAYADMVDMLQEAEAQQQQEQQEQQRQEAEAERVRAAAAAAAAAQQQEPGPAAGVLAGQQGAGTAAAGAAAPAAGSGWAGRGTRRTTRTTTEAAGGSAAGAAGGQGPDDRSSGRKRSVRSTRGAS